MKNSLFKRAIAVVAAAPIALTQCLTYANAAETNDATQATATTQADDGSKITLDDLLYIPAEKTVSDWNQLLWAKLATAVTRSGNFDITTIAKKAIEKAGQYKDLVEYGLNELIIPNGVSYKITGNNDVVISGKISNPDFNRNLSLTSGNALAVQAENYNAPNLTKIDFSDIDVSGVFTLTIETSKLMAGTEVPVKFEYKTADKTYAAGELFDLALDTMAKVKAKGDAAIDKEIPAQFADQAKADYAAKIKLVTDKIEKAKKKYTDAMTAKRGPSQYQNISKVIAKANNWLKEHNYDKKVTIPETGAEIAKNDVVLSIYAELLKSISPEGNIDITAEDLGKFADSVTDIQGTLANAVANGEARFDDAEQDEVKKWVEKQGYAFVDSYKKITAKVDFSTINTVNAGLVDVQIERVLVTDTTTTALLQHQLKQQQLRLQLHQQSLQHHQRLQHLLTQQHHQIQQLHHQRLQHLLKQLQHQIQQLHHLKQLQHQIQQLHLHQHHLIQQHLQLQQLLLMLQSQHLSSRHM